MKEKPIIRHKNLKRASPVSRKRRHSDVAASYASCSATSTSSSTSIAQQQKRCRKQATANGHSIPAYLQFADEVGCGVKRLRAGLDAMLEAARTGKFCVLYLDCVSRLDRDSFNGYRMLTWLVAEQNVRIVSIADGFDTTKDDWKKIVSTRCVIKDLVREWFRSREKKMLAD